VSLITLSILLFNVTLEVTGTFEKFPLLVFIDDIEWIFLLPPFIFLFILHRTEHSLRKSKRLLFLYIPFIYAFILGVIINFDVILHLYEINVQHQEWITIATWIRILLIVYVILTIVPICFFYIRIVEDTEERKWLNYLITIIYILLLIWVILVLSAIAFSDFDNWDYLKGLALISSIVIHWVAYVGVIKNRLYRDKKDVARLLDSHKTDAKTERTSLNINETSEITKKEGFTPDNIYYLKLQKLCKEEQLYRDPSLSRDKVANILGISPGYVSQFINAITGDNFATYINDYRVESVKKLIIDPTFDNYSLLAIGLESGFTSKTAFYTAFKKNTGMTPNAYKKLRK